MRLEIPTLTRCCGCCPLRRGIIILGYLSLAVAVFFMWIELQFAHSWSEFTVSVFRGASFCAETWLPVLMYCTEIAFIVLLLVGAHMKKPGPMLVFYYYGVTTTAAAPVIFIWTLATRAPETYHLEYFYYFMQMVDLSIVFIGVVTQVYLLLLIRSELRKPQESLCFVNHLSEVCVQQPTINNISSL
ncbi:uncharacterized protein LOC125235582 [Leguminivora glycinivorella]|uniref:uncharacterized protein LOC125235582 n=1 Tax=Leguminivora glycinivorella TaxID=1035111 RepID=UPI00200F95F6|nr:uncharacterized protein LOC125235582 [Leguminivora glycinivorella]